MLLTDFHIHSQFSDGELSISEIVDLYGERGFGAIAITDHLCERKTFLGKAARLLNRTLSEQTFKLYMEVLRKERARAWSQYEMLLIPGIEITKNSFSHNKSAHILGLGITQYIDPELSIPDISAALRAQGALVVAAHPVSTRELESQTFYLWKNKEKLSKYFDLWEVASGKHIFSEVMETDLPKIANSDMHFGHQIESWKTLVSSELNQESIFSAIKNQDITFSYFKEGRNASC